MSRLTNKALARQALPRGNTRAKVVLGQPGPGPGCIPVVASTLIPLRLKKRAYLAGGLEMNRPAQSPSTKALA